MYIFHNYYVIQILFTLPAFVGSILQQWADSFNKLSNSFFKVFNWYLINNEI